METAAEPPRQAAEFLADVRRLEREGELFQAYDLARQGLEQHPDDIALKYRAVLCLASSGATRRAAEEFVKNRLAESAREDSSGLTPRLVLDIASLSARLLKDAALGSTGQERSRQLREAADAYGLIYRDAKEAVNPEAYYPGINSATLLLLAGDTEKARELATAILADLASWPTETKGYYEIATELEAYLILGDADAAHHTAVLLGGEWQRNPAHDYRGLASTIQQLRLVIGATGMAFDLGEALKPPTVVHYLGHIISAPGGSGRFPAAQEETVRNRIDAALDRIKPGFAHGSLAAGADIIFAERLLARGAGLHVVLPFQVEEFVEVSVRGAGNGWVDRFHDCLARAESVRFATEDRYLGDDELFTYCSQLAMGLALLRARHLSGRAEQIAVWDGQPPRGPAGTSVDIATWKRTGMPQTLIPVGADSTPPVAPVMPAEVRRNTPSPTRGRSTRAMLFGDIKGFSKLNDEQLPHFVEHILGAFAQVIDEFRSDIALANTWGDGLFVVFADAGKAAACALALQEAMGRLDLAAAGLPDTMALRLGGHLGPVYTARDPILKHENYFGAHVSRAARIEPVTPEKLVYVTETLAAVLALHNADRFTCQYVGMTQAAKGYGTMRMFLLGRPAHGPGVSGD